ncbi:MAG: fibronectin type III-like domain-contianing protein, partial [Spirochaetaceae bacterium]|nr:fibronectin type III-like domain-contianing protein [Spirochaetaceae bacterium]
PAWPFGFGLSYTNFSYHDLALSAASIMPAVSPTGDDGGAPVLEASFSVTNTGTRDGAAVPQVYVAAKEKWVPRPLRELRGWKKVFLKAGETKQVTIPLYGRSFAYFNAYKKAWAVEGGDYEIELGVSSADIALRAAVTVSGDGSESLYENLPAAAPDYYAGGAIGAGKNLVIGDRAFEAVYGRPLPPSARLPGEPYTINTTLSEIQDTKLGRYILAEAEKNIAQTFGGEAAGDMRLMVEKMLGDLPLRGLGMMGEVSQPVINAMVDVLNKKPFAGLKLSFRMAKKKK